MPEGLKSYLGGGVALDYARGCEVADSTWPESEIIPTPMTSAEQSGIEEAVEKGRQSDLIIAVLGEDEKGGQSGIFRISRGLSQVGKTGHWAGRPKAHHWPSGRRGVL